MSTIAEVLQKPKGDNVTGLLVRVVSAGPQNEKESTYRPGETYTLQPATVADDTGQCSLSLTDGPLLKKGMWVAISARENSKGKLAGALVGEYQGKKEIRATGFGLEIADSPAAPPVTAAQAALEGMAPAWGAAEQGAASLRAAQKGGARAPYDVMSEGEARDLLIRSMNKLAVACGFSFEWLSELPAEYFQPIKEMAVTILMGVEKGNIELRKGDTQ